MLLMSRHVQIHSSYIIIIHIRVVYLHELAQMHIFVHLAIFDPLQMKVLGFKNKIYNFYFLRNKSNHTKHFFSQFFFLYLKLSFPQNCKHHHSQFFIVVIQWGYYSIAQKKNDTFFLIIYEFQLGKNIKLFCASHFS